MLHEVRGCITTNVCVCIFAVSIRAWYLFNLTADIFHVPDPIKARCTCHHPQDADRVRRRRPHAAALRLLEQLPAQLPQPLGCARFPYSLLDLPSRFVMAQCSLPPHKSRANSASRICSPRQQFAICCMHTSLP